MSSMWANPDLPFDPKNALPIRHPLLVAECRCWRPLRFSHVLAARQASSTEMGQLFQPLAVLSHHLHCYNNGLRTRKAPSHNDGWVTPHYTISLTATAEEHPNTVMSAPLRHPSEAGTEHIDTLSAGGPRHCRSPAMELSRHVDVSVHTGPQPTLPSTHSIVKMITSPTRITPHSSTLIDHIYTSNTSIVSNILVPATGISDHFPVCCTLSVKTVKPVLNV